MSGSVERKDRLGTSRASTCTQEQPDPMTAETGLAFTERALDPHPETQSERETPERHISVADLHRWLDHPVEDLLRHGGPADRRRPSIGHQVGGAVPGGERAADRPVDGIRLRFGAERVA